MKQNKLAHEWDGRDTEQKMKFSIKDLFNKCDQIRSLLRIRSHLLKNSLMENFIFCAMRHVESNIDQGQ